MAKLDCDPKELRYLILNSDQPLLLRKFLNWDLHKWGLEEWLDFLNDEKLVFRCGKNAFTKEPQWERTTAQIKTTFKDFLEFAKQPQTDWMYFDYKYLKEWFNDLDQMKQNIKWETLGFPEVTHEDCTIWIGSQGAHTPCHVDTYGCNLITQIYGRKQWIIFPPNENLQPSRIPYEESSIYSKINFFSPTVNDFKHLNLENQCRKIILEPGDVLFLPHKWWHYVENLDTAISINVWLPVPEDDKERVDEALVQLMIQLFTKELSEEAKSVILNPNADSEVSEITLNSSLSLTNKCKDIYKNKSVKKKRLDKSEQSSFNLSDMLSKYVFIESIPALSSKDFGRFVENQCNRFMNSDSAGVAKTDKLKEITDLVETFTDPDVITLLREKFLLK